jgi:hypothetical protein
LINNRMEPSTHLQRLAAAIRRHHLEAPALMLITLVRPLGTLGSHLLLLAQPLAPGDRWQTSIAQTATALEDEAMWTELENLLR